MQHHCHAEMQTRARAFRYPAIAEAERLPTRCGCGSGLGIQWSVKRSAPSSFGQGLREPDTFTRVEILLHNRVKDDGCFAETCRS